MSNQARYDSNRRTSPYSDPWISPSREQQIRVLPYSHGVRTSTTRRVSTQRTRSRDDLLSDLKIHLNSISPDSQKSNENFVTFLANSNAGPETYSKFLRVASKDDLINMNDATLQEFVNNAKHVYVKKILNEIDKNSSQQNSDKLYETKALDEITAQMIFDGDRLREFLLSKLNLRNDSSSQDETFQNYTDILDEKFPNSNELNKKLVTFLVNNRASESDFKELGKNPTELYSTDNKHIKRFFNMNKRDEIMRSLQQIDEKNAAQNYGKLDRTRLLDNVTIEMMFEPEKMTEYLTEHINFCAKKVFNKLLLYVLPLNDMSYLWGRTPEKCIVYEICNKTSISNYREAQVDRKISEYQKPVVRTFDEADEIFFDLVDEDLSKMETTIDSECLIAFIKRDNEMKKLYNVDLLVDEEQRRTVVETFVKKYKKTYL